MHCENGTRPPPQVPCEDVRRLHQFSMGDPPTGASMNAWHLRNTRDLVAPLILVGLGAAAAYITHAMLKDGPDTCLCRRVPRLPIFLPLWSMGTLVYSWSGSGKRQVAVTHVFDNTTIELTNLQQDLETILRVSHNISDVEEHFREANDQVPNSCRFPTVTQGMMVQAVNAIDDATDQSFQLVGRLNDMFHALPKRISQLLATADYVRWLMGYLPLLPMLTVILGTVAIVVFTCMAFCNPEPKIAERASRALTKHGSYAFPILTLMLTIFAAMYLHIGIIMSGFCLAVDENVLGLIHTMEFELEGQYERDNKQVTEDVRGTVDFYVSGIAPNPAQKILEELSTNIQTFSKVRNATKMVQSVAGFACPAFHKVPMDETIRTLDADMDIMRELLRPENIWPYYDRVVHRTACQELPEHAWELIWFNTIMGLVLLPVLAVTADVDLKRMVKFKQSNSFSSLEEESDSEEDFYHYEKSAPTYTHVTNTVYPDQPGGKREAKVHKKTFLA